MGSSTRTKGARTQAETRNRLMLKARDAMDRSFETAIDVPALARTVGMSEAHFIRTFKEVFAETPHRYLQRRRVERAMYLLRETERSVTDVCFDIGFNSLGTFSRTFKDITGVTPTEFRQRWQPALSVPTCFAMAWARPSSFGEARAETGSYSDPADAAQDSATPSDNEQTNDELEATP